MTGKNPRTDRLFEIGSAYRQAKVLLSAVELGVFSELANGPLEASDLANRAWTMSHTRWFWRAIPGTVARCRHTSG